MRIEFVLRYMVSGSLDGSGLEISLARHTSAAHESHFTLSISAGRYDAKPPAEVRVDSRVAEKLLDEFRACRLTVMPDYRMGLDGNTQELEFGDWPGSVHLEWWSILPPSWEALAGPLRRLCALANIDPAEFVVTGG